MDSVMWVTSCPAKQLGKDTVGKFRRCVGGDMVVSAIFAQVRHGEAVTVVTSQVTRMGERRMGSPLQDFIQERVGGGNLH